MAEDVEAEARPGEGDDQAADVSQVPRGGGAHEAEKHDVALAALELVHGADLGGAAEELFEAEKWRGLMELEV